MKRDTSAKELQAANSKADRPWKRSSKIEDAMEGPKNFLPFSMLPSPVRKPDALLLIGDYFIDQERVMFPIGRKRKYVHMNFFEPGQATANAVCAST